MPILKSVDANAALASPQPARAVGSFPWGFALIMGALAALGPFSVDTYFPSFPAIASHFGVSRLQVQSTLSLYLTALALMSLFHGALSAQVTLVSGFAPAIAPVLGGWLHVWFGWRGPFMFLGLMGTVILLACFFKLPESLPRESWQAFHPAPPIAWRGHSSGLGTN